MMYTVYILHNSVSKRYYIGSTNNIERRLKEHRSGHTQTTRQIGTWILIYHEVYITALEARRRERKIKSYKGGNAFRKLLRG